MSELETRITEADREVAESRETISKLVEDKQLSGNHGKNYRNALKFSTLGHTNLISCFTDQWGQNIGPEGGGKKEKEK